MIRFFCDLCGSQVEHFDEMNEANGVAIAPGPRQCEVNVRVDPAKAKIILCQGCWFNLPLDWGGHEQKTTPKNPRSDKSSTSVTRSCEPGSRS